jgi:hypothetical protein
MDYGHLVTILEQALVLTRECGVEQLPRMLYEAEQDAEKSDRRAAALLQALQGEPELDIFNGQVQFVGSTGVGLTLHFLADWLVRRAFSVGTEQAASDLRRYLSADDLPFIQVIAVGGLELRESLELGQGVELIPWNALPADRGKRHALESFFRGFSGFPHAAIVRPMPLPKLHLPSNQTSIQRRDAPKPLEHGDLYDLLPCIVLVGPTAPYPLLWWLEPPDWAPVLGLSFHGGDLEASSISRIKTITDADRVRELVEAFRSLDAVQKDRLRVPMQRLNAAMRRLRSADQAIELGIVLESLFLSDISDDRGELAFRLALRAARYLGNDTKARAALFRTFRSLYTLRSIAVHRGHLGDSLKGVGSVPHVLEEGFTLAAQAISRILADGFPDWNEIQFA